MVVDELEAYYDAAPRRFATVEEVGPFTLFVGPPGGWSFHARPRLGGPGGYDTAAVGAVLARMRELGVPETIEWVHEVTPDLLDPVLAEGSLTVSELPLMVLDGAPAPADPPAGVTVRMLAPHEEERLVAVSGVARLAFGPPQEVPAGAAERDAAAGRPSEPVRSLLRSGEARIAVAEHPGLGILATGRHLQVGGVSEVVGVATLPAEQGAGLGSAVTRLLVADAAGRGIGTVFLTAASGTVARLYARLGFRRVGTAYAAERARPESGDVAVPPLPGGEPGRAVEGPGGE